MGIMVLCPPFLYQIQDGYRAYIFLSIKLQTISYTAVDPERVEKTQYQVKNGIQLTLEICRKMSQAEVLPIKHRHALKSSIRS